MKNKIKGFFVMLMLGVAYALGVNLDNDEEVPSLYNQICNSRWYNTLDTVTDLRFYTSNVLSISQAGLSPKCFKYCIMNNSMNILRQNTSEVLFTMKIIRATDSYLVLEGKWDYPLEYHKSKCII